MYGFTNFLHIYMYIYIYVYKLCYYLLLSSTRQDLIDSARKETTPFFRFRQFLTYIDSKRKGIQRYQLPVALGHGNITTWDLTTATPMRGHPIAEKPTASVTLQLSSFTGRSYALSRGWGQFRKPHTSPKARRREETLSGHHPS